MDRATRKILTIGEERYPARKQGPQMKSPDEYKNGLPHYNVWLNPFWVAVLGYCLIRIL